MLLGLFLLSGATSLVYQILWIRQLSLVVGSTVYAISVVVGAFMAGLALGSAFLGGRADRGDHPLRIYGLLEGGIGLCALVVPLLFALIGRAAAAHEGHVGATPLALFAGSVVLLVPTALMGGTLPVLARYVAAFRGSRGRLVGLLYCVNTTGAIAGAAVTGFVLIRVIGVRNTNMVAAGINLALCAAAIGLARAWPEPQRQKLALPAGVLAAEPQLLGPVTVTYFVNGLVGLALEVLWTRAIMLFSGNTIYAFTVILTTLLVGIVAGSGLMAAVMPRVRYAPRLLGGLQCCIGLVAGLTPLGLAAVGVPLFQSVQGKAAPLGLMAQALSVYVVSALFMLPTTLLLGASFPLVARVAADYTEQVGRVVGRVYALNTVGAVLGSLLSTFLFLPWIGIQKSILLFSLFSVLTGVYLTWRARGISWTGFGLLAALALAGAFGASPNHFRAMLERSIGVHLGFYAEGIETTVGAYPSRKAQRPVLLINNVALDDHGVVHKLLAHIPALLHPDPQRVLVLGFGVGITSQSFSAYGIPVNDCVEISREVMRAAPQFASLNGNIAGRGDAAFHAYVADGRRFLLARPQKYDIMALDANSGKLRNAGVGKLYTREFFELCKSRLAPNGLITVYASPNTTLQEFKMIVRTFAEVFPHTSLWIDPVYGETCVLLGGMQPLRIDLQRWLGRLQRPAVQADLAVFDLDPPGMVLSAFLMGEERVRLLCAGGSLNTDDHPVMEFYSLRMSTFDVDDQPLFDLGLPLYKESVLAWVDADASWPAGFREYVEAEERAFSSVRQAWLLRPWNWTQEIVDQLRTAAAIHPEAEHLRTLVGCGRRDFARAMQAAGPAADPEALARAATIAAGRGRYDVAAPLFDRALARASDLPAGDRPQLMLEAARCALQLGQLDRCQSALQQAEQLGADVRLDRAELLLASPTPDTHTVQALLQARAAAPLAGADRMRAFRLAEALRARGELEAGTLSIEARCLESFGDWAGALAVYGELLGRDPARDDARERARACGLELALRLDATSGAGAPGADPGPNCTSAFTGARVRASALPRADHLRADPWLELAALYLKTDRPLEAYRKARAARTVEPERPETYLAVGQAASRIGGRDIAKLAFARALELDGNLEAARTALRQLSAL